MTAKHSLPLGSRNDAFMAWLYFVPSINTWPDLDALRGFEHAVFSWRGIAGLGISQIRELLYLKIAIPVDVDEMRIGLIPADDDVCVAP